MSSRDVIQATQRGWEELALWGRDPELNELDTLPAGQPPTLIGHPD